MESFSDLAIFHSASPPLQNVTGCCLEVQRRVRPGVFLVYEFFVLQKFTKAYVIIGEPLRHFVRHQSTMYHLPEPAEVSTELRDGFFEPS